MWWRLSGRKSTLQLQTKNRESKNVTFSTAQLNKEQPFTRSKSQTKGDASGRLGLQHGCRQVKRRWESLPGNRRRCPKCDESHTTAKCRWILSLALRPRDTVDSRSWFSYSRLSQFTLLANVSNTLWISSNYGKLKQLQLTQKFPGIKSLTAYQTGLAPLSRSRMLSRQPLKSSSSLIFNGSWHPCCCICHHLLDYTYFSISSFLYSFNYSRWHQESYNYCSPFFRLSRFYYIFQIAFSYSCLSCYTL